jgi:DNA-binding transcriptional MerR regulator
MKTYTSFQVSKIIGEKYQRLRGWIDCGAIVPSIRRADGGGARNIFSEKDLITIKIFKELVFFGFKRDVAAAIVKTIDDSFKVKTEFFELRFKPNR